MKTINNPRTPASISGLHAQAYTLSKPSRHTVTARPLQDWAQHPRIQRGLRSDLRRLLSAHSAKAEIALMALLWAGIIPSMTIIGTLAGY